MYGIQLLLRQLLLVAALLGYGAAASAHDHDAPPRPSDGLCAICVYGGAVGGVGTPQELPAAQFWQPAPDVSPCPFVPAPPHSAARIRGPPSDV